MADLNQLGFEDIAELHASFGAAPPISLLESIELWRAVQKVAGATLEIGRVDGFSTAVLAAAAHGRRVCSIGERSEVVVAIARFLRQHQLVYHTELRRADVLASVKGSFKLLGCVEHGQTCCGAFRKPISSITKRLDQVKFGRAQRTIMQGLAPRTLHFDE